jgi:hypothetical protein
MCECGIEGNISSEAIEIIKTDRKTIVFQPTINKYKKLTKQYLIEESIDRKLISVLNDKQESEIDNAIEAKFVEVEKLIEQSLAAGHIKFILTVEDITTAFLNSKHFKELLEIKNFNTDAIANIIIDLVLELIEIVCSDYYNSDKEDLDTDLKYIVFILLKEKLEQL